VSTKKSSTNPRTDAERHLLDALKALRATSSGPSCCSAIVLLVALRFAGLPSRGLFQELMYDDMSRVRMSRLTRKYYDVLCRMHHGVGYKTPLVEGHGNFGFPRKRGWKEHPAAALHTDCRLTKAGESWKGSE
jgi:hypothetical protein